VTDPLPRQKPAHVDVARVVPTGATELEPARAFLQDRLGLWAFWVFTLSTGFYAINVLTAPFVRPDAPALIDFVLYPGNLDHLAASLVFGGVWLLMRRGPLSLEVLRSIDVGALVIGCALFALMGAYLTRMQLVAGLDVAIGAYAGLLACANTVMARAIFVPSTPRRTLLVSTAAMAPLIPAAWFAGGSTVEGTANIATWCAVSIAIATVGSQIIFGLRTEAARIRRLGQYTLERQIGSGGMGVVYRASHAMLRRPTAIKLLPPDRAGETALARFEREVQMTAQLSHPNTVAIYDYGRTPDGVFYYAMEYLDGINLEDLVRLYGAQPPGRVLSILDQVCGALAEAHERGLVHRDIKPANIILTERGGEPDVAKVVDFGLVKPFASEDPSLTMSTPGVVTGTPLYLSPEALTAPDAGDPRSDLYALGAVGYFLVTGRPLFDGTTVAEIIGHHLHTEPEPPSRRLGHALPLDVEQVILECLRKTPADRPADARALRERLRRSEAPPWTMEQAVEWWARFRASAPSSDITPALVSSLPTISVDVANRVTRTAVW
jgi:serine/threonine protein kinase